MTDSAIISAVLNYYDAIDADDADNLGRRARLLRFLDQIYTFVWNIREWEWTFNEDTVSISAGANTGTLPDDFMEFSRQGGLWSPDHVRMTEVTRRQLYRYRNETAGSTNTRIFAIAGGAVQLGYTASSAQVLPIAYRMISDSAAFTDTDADDPIIPAKYHATVLIPGLVYKAQVTKQDSRQNWAGEFKEGLAQMCAVENPSKTGVIRMPLSVRGGF